MEETYQLAYAVQPGKSERELELWSGTRKICGFKDIREERMLEELVQLANIGTHLTHVEDDQEVPGDE